MYLVALYKIISPLDNKIISIASRQRSKWPLPFFGCAECSFVVLRAFIFVLFYFFVLSNRLILNLEVF